MLSSLPSPDEMYQAVLRRDRGYEGIFFTGVRTTGIFCRPVCPARKPKRTNVEFFATAAEAVHSGYRPCKRCHPMRTPSSTLVQYLLDVVEENPEARWTAQDLKTRGIDPDTARRQFQKHFGLTFAGYVRARRMGQALATIRTGTSVIDAQLDAGFDSASGFRAAFHKLFGTSPSSGATASCFVASWIGTPLGAMLAIADEEGLHLLEFVDRRGLGTEIEQLRSSAGGAILPGENAHLLQIRDELTSYFSGKAFAFKTPVVRHGSAFRRSVWAALTVIPFGETRSYAEIAAAIGRPTAVRAVAQANGANRLALLIPCHRVIGSDGGLTGYGGGRWRKRWLIDHERARGSVSGTG